VNESQIFAAALRYAAPADRAAYLDAACAGDPRLRAGVEALLRAHATDPDFLERPAVPPAVTVDLPPGPGADGDRPSEVGGGENAGAVLAGRYKLLEAIGEGGMGTVWLAQQTEPVKRLVAVKLIKAGMDSKAVLARFEAERQALALMDHANIAKVFDAGATPDGRPFFVMELVKGRPITAYCDEAKLPPRQRLELFVPVCQAIQHAHQKGVIHRDIKPNNVLVALYDDRPVPKVIDFGVAKATGQQLTERTLHTGFGSVVGTPEYMSPEQASFNQLDVDTRSDVYSLGVVLYELLAGSPPFSRKDLERAGLLEILRVIREQEPQKPSSRLSTADGLPSLAAKRGTEPARLTRLVRGDLDWIVMKALEKDRVRRYETANGFAADVQRYLADEPVHARPPSAGYRLRKLVRRNRGAAAAAALVLLALVVGVAGTVWQAVRATGERDAKQHALDDLGQEQRKTAAALDQSRLMSADLAFDKGQLLGERGDTDLALLWMARTLALAPADAADLQAAARTGLGAWRRHVNTLRLALPHQNALTSLTILPDGTLVTATEEGPNNVTMMRRWNPTTGQAGDPLNVDNNGELDTPKYFLSPDGKHFLMSVNYDDGQALQSRDMVTGRALWETPRMKGRIFISVAFSPDSRTALIGMRVGTSDESLSSTGTARLHDLAAGTPLGPELSLDRPVFASAFRPDGKGFVTACGLWGNGTLKAEARFWNLDGTNWREPLELPCMAPGVDLSRDGTKLLTANWDRKARLWNLTTPGEPLVLQHEGPVVCALFHPNGQTILTGGFEGHVRYWDLAGRPIGQPMRHIGLVQDMKLSADGKSLLVGIRRANGTRLWDLADIGPTETPEPTFFPLAYSPDRRTILTLEDAQTVRLRDTATGQPVGRPLTHPRPVFLAGASSLPGIRHACSSDRRRAVTLDEKNVCRLWNTESGKVVKELRPFPELGVDQPTFYGAAFDPQSTIVAVGSFYGTGHTWNATTGELLKAFKHEPNGPCFGFAFTPDGRTMLSGGSDNSARFWDPATGVEQGTPLLQVTGVFAVAIGPDDKTAVTGGPADVSLWDVTTRQRRFLLSGHTAGINDVAFSPDGRLVASASLDGTARLWDVASGKPVGPTLRHPGSVARVAFGLDGRTLLTGTDDRTARSWPVPTPLTGSTEHLELWAQVVTGLELEPDGTARILDTEEWQQRQQRLTAASEAKPKP
jgi:WD40 repeat protein/serine/threonine protein kinase